MARLARCPDTSLFHLPSLPPNNSEFNYEVHFLLAFKPGEIMRRGKAWGWEWKVDGTATSCILFFPVPFHCSQISINWYKVSTKNRKMLLAVQLGEHDIRQEPRPEFPCAWAPVWCGRRQGRPDLNPRQIPNHWQAPSESAAHLGSLRLKAARGRGCENCAQRGSEEVKVREVFSRMSKRRHF